MAIGFLLFVFGSFHFLVWALDPYHISQKAVSTLMKPSFSIVESYNPKIKKNVFIEVLLCCSFIQISMFLPFCLLLTLSLSRTLQSL